MQMNMHNQILLGMREHTERDWVGLEQMGGQAGRRVGGRCRQEVVYEIATSELKLEN